MENVMFTINEKSIFVCAPYSIWCIDKIKEEAKKSDIIIADFTNSNEKAHISIIGLLMELKLQGKKIKIIIKDKFFDGKLDFFDEVHLV